MSRLTDIQHALRQISADDRVVIAAWLQDLVDAESGALGIAEPSPTHALALPSHMTIDEFFEFEEASPLHHEYVNGVAYAMSSPSVAHATIISKLSFLLMNRLRGGPCEVFASTLKLRIESATNDIVYHPDLIVACNREEWAKNYVCNPKLVGEVLSPSTKHIDRREKAMAYRSVSSIDEYVLIDQDEHKVVIHRRAENWRPQVYAGPQAVADLHSISLAVPLTQIYAGTLEVR